MTLRIDRARAKGDDDSSYGPDTIVVALVNNMPDGAIRSTEQQFARLLNAASGTLDVRLVLYEIPEVTRSDVARGELLRAYRPVDELLRGRSDGLIVTGCEPKAPKLQEEAYWDKLSRTIDWANENTISSIWSCLAAHAAVLHIDGIERRAFASKLSGVFECEKTSEHDLVSGLPARWMVPHSRHYGLAQEDLVKAGYCSLTASSIAGVDMFLKQRSSLYVFCQGHLEYEADVLLREYLRDITKYAAHQRDPYPEVPVGLFHQDIVARFETLKLAAKENRSAGLMANGPILEAQNQLVHAWWEPAVAVYRSWLSWIAVTKGLHADKRRH